MHTSEDVHDENRRLRRTMRDLVALSTLPAIWAGLAPDAIARSLADVLLSTLALDFVYVRLTGFRQTVEVVRSAKGPDATAAVTAVVAPILNDERIESARAISDPFGGGALNAAVIRFGPSNAAGVVVAAARRADFPTEPERLLLGVGANQTAIVVQRGQASEHLRTSEEKYHALFDSMDEGYCVIEVIFDADDRPVDYRFVEINPAFVKHTGLQDALGRTMRELAPDMDQFWFDTYGRVARTGEPGRFVSEAKALGRWYDVYAFRLGASQDCRVAVLFNDITDRRQAEREREQLLGRLQDADRRKDEFLATLAHELRNPLAPIRNAVQIVKMSADPEVLEEARTVIERQLGQMVRLIDDLMDVSRISRDKLELRKERVDLAKVVQNAVETSRPLIDRMGHNLILKLPPQPIDVEADPTRLAQVFLNLLNNSAKYTEPEGRIWLTAERQGSDVVVSVRDNGIGIPADMLPSVFDLFTQIEAGMSRSQGGLGIGLSLVKRLVELHGGSVSAQSGGSGRGSTFTVRIPVLVEAAEPTRQHQEPARKSALRILVVDDNRDSADSLGMMLRLMGNDTQTAYEGEHAIAVAESFGPQVVLLDIGLPKMSGHDVCRHIRAQPWSRGMVLIALTGWGQDEDVRRSIEAGFDHHMVKPVNPAVLMKLLAELNSAQSTA